MPLGVSRHLHGRCAVHFVFRTEKCIGNLLACMGHCGVYHIFVVLVKLSVKSSSCRKLFNAVHKAQVSWNRIKPLLTRKDERTAIEDQTAENHARECKEKKRHSPSRQNRDNSAKNTDQSSEFCLSGWKENFRRHLSFRRKKDRSSVLPGRSHGQVNA